MIIFTFVSALYSLTNSKLCLIYLAFHLSQGIVTVSMKGIGFIIKGCEMGTFFNRTCCGCFKTLTFPPPLKASTANIQLYLQWLINIHNNIFFHNLSSFDKLKCILYGFYVIDKHKAAEYIQMMMNWYILSFVVFQYKFVCIVLNTPFPLWSMMVAEWCFFCIKVRNIMMDVAKFREILERHL